RDVGAALPLKLQLRAFDALAKLIVADRERALDRLMVRVLRELGLLLLAVLAELLRRGRIVSVTIDDHRSFRLPVSGALRGRAERTPRRVYHFGAAARGLRRFGPVADTVPTGGRTEGTRARRLRAATVSNASFRFCP